MAFTPEPVASSNVTPPGILSEDDFSPLHEFSIYELVFWFIIYGTVAFLAVSGNCLVICIVFSRSRMQTVTNYFIVNLAVADAMTGLLAVPFKFQAALLQMWLLPDFMCGLVPFIETVSLSVSVFTLTSTAVDRLRAILYPSTKMKKSMAKGIIFMIWTVSVACSVPYGIGHNVTIIPNVNKTVCMPTHGEEDWWKIYNVYLTIVQYYVPLFVINGAYCFIGYKVWLSKPVFSSLMANPATQSFERNKKRVIKMLVIVVAVFTFCWLPYETYLVLCEVRPGVNNYFYINIVFFCCHWLAMSNSCLNPIIYGIYNEKFHKEYRRIFQRCCGQQDFSPLASANTQLPSALPGIAAGISNLQQTGAKYANHLPSASPAHQLASSRSANLLRLSPRVARLNGSVSNFGNNDSDESKSIAMEREKSCHYYIASELGRDDEDEYGNY